MNGFIKATGRLRHCFFGDYSARIALYFNSVFEREKAQAVLPPAFQFVAGCALGWSGSSSELKNIKRLFKGWRLEVTPCAREECNGKVHEFDGLDHSIDYGPAFTICLPTVSVVPGEPVEARTQTELLLLLLLPADAANRL